MTDTNDLYQQVKQLAEKVKELEQQLRTMRNNINYTPDVIPQPQMPYAEVTVCPKCHMGFGTVSSYYCPKPDCPMKVNITYAN